MARKIKVREGIKNINLQEFMKNLLKKDILIDGAYDQLYDIFLIIEKMEICSESLKKISMNVLNIQRFFLLSVTDDIDKSEMKNDRNYPVFIEVLKKNGFLNC